MKVLLVDNYDSFTFNLAQAIGMGGGEVTTVLNDRIPPRLELDRFEALVIGPGPGRADRPDDVGASTRLLSRVPHGMSVVGVCMGHQLIGLWCGARLIRTPSVVHGKTSPLLHTGRGPFAGLPQRCSVMRYHSWALDTDALPEDLEALAWSDDGVLMAMAHRKLPWWGLQFHPESVGTPLGVDMLRRLLSSPARDRHASRDLAVV